MDELRAELERHGQARLAARPDPTSDPIARLEQGHAAPGREQVARGDEARRAGADYDDVTVRHASLLTRAPAPGPRSGRRAPRCRPRDATGSAARACLLPRWRRGAR